MTATNRGVGGFEGSGRGPDEFVISGCLAPTPNPLYEKKFHRICTFCMEHPYGPDLRIPLASYGAGYKHVF